MSRNKLGNAGQDAFGERPAGLHLLMLFQDPDNQILPLFLEYFYCLIMHCHSSRGC